MSDRADLSAEGHIWPCRRRARDACLRDDEIPLANLAVMPDMDEIVDLRAASDDSRSRRSAVDADM